MKNNSPSYPSAKCIADVISSLKKGNMTNHYARNWRSEDLVLVNGTEVKVGETLLHNAVRNYASEEEITYLVNTIKIPINSQSTAFNNTAFHILFESKKINMGIFEVLLNLGCDPNIKNCFGNTAIHLAALREEPEEFFKAFINKGFDIDIPSDLTSLTPLHVLCVYNTTITTQALMRTIPLLIHAGADVHTKDSSGRSVIFNTFRQFKLFPFLELSRHSDLVASLNEGIGHHLREVELVNRSWNEYIDFARVTASNTLSAVIAFSAQTIKSIDNIIHKLSCVYVGYTPNMEANTSLSR